MSAPRGHAEVRAGWRVPATPTYASVTAALDRAVTRGLHKITGTAVGPYQSAVVRIGVALTWLLFLLREFPHRAALYGPHSAWGFDLAQRLLAGNHAFSVLMWSDSRAWFEICYAFAILASAALLVGWRTRTSALMFMVGVLSLQNRSVFMGDGGDNVVHILAIYLAFTRCGLVWSLDSRRARRRAEAEAEASRAAAAEAEAGSGAGEPVAGPRAPVEADAAAPAFPPASTVPARAAVPGRAGVDPVGIALWAVFGVVLLVATFGDKLSHGWDLVFWACWVGQAVWWAVRRHAPGEPRTVFEIIANVVHNGAMLVVVVEVCLIYSTAGWYKIQGSRWQDGTALYYPLHLDDFTPWPALSHMLASHAVVVMLITYGTVIVQVAFPFTLFNRRVKNVLLVGMMIEHASIAVVLGLPFFSLAMISADAVFLPTGFLLWVEYQALGRRRGRDLAARALPEQRADDPGTPAAGPPPSPVT
ncbi:putative membrane protein [Actinacidiphila reveromycinica]|uniref:Putative membrane protein n=1 Tax=Actinacidiphila reveromycinica TaxID=659352 RepID=A0A7U3UU55_9ACTN|nr:HTTM domain-containing protein [Streptomyces sp. SN-593]BBA98770.1 putative membrane protein [Streptomyces sp. SN-593]